MKTTLTTTELMSKPFETGPLKIHFSRNSVSLDGCDIVLQPKVLELLVLLCAAQGETLSKQQLNDALWPDVVVGPESLANTMARLRKALNDDAKNPQFIKTVQRKGYLWMPKVKSATSPQKIHRYWLTASVGSLIVLVVMYLFPSQPKEEFMFPDLSIKKLEDGGYEIDVGIDGELTEEKKAKMLEELKRITGEEDSGMEFTVDAVEPVCAKDNKSDEHGKPCKAP